MIAIEHGDAISRAAPQRPAAVTVAPGLADEAPARMPQLSEIPPVQSRLMRMLQQAVHDRAMREAPGFPGYRPAAPAVLQRQVRIKNVNRGAWLKKGAKLPEIPDAIAQRYQAYVVPKVKAYAEQLRDDKVQDGRTFETAESFYQPLFDRAVSEARPGDGKGSKAWGLLAAAVQREGQLTEVPWSSFTQAAAGTLLTELLMCPVHRSTSGTTAYHGNKHEKLPKKVREDLDTLDFDVQAANTPYVEFLIAGHKKENEIERGILDREAGQIYITAHYDTGSIVWLSGAPANLVANWQAKASEYDAGR